MKPSHAKIFLVILWILVLAILAFSASEALLSCVRRSRPEMIIPSASVNYLPRS